MKIIVLIACILPVALWFDKVSIGRSTSCGLRNKCPGGQSREEELGYRCLLEALNAKSVREGWAETIGLQQRTQRDKAVFVTTGIHFC